jgi:hypothetical protein
MKQLILLFNFFLLSSNLSAQCYIQYTYNASGHRIKREYVGGCGKPASRDDMEEMVKHAVSDSLAGIRTELIRNDLDTKIRVFPNPTFDIINIQSDHAEIIGRYSITNLNGHQVLEGAINDETTSADMSRYSPGAYILTIRSQDHQIIYATTIIKQ